MPQFRESCDSPPGPSSQLGGPLSHAVAGGHTAAAEALLAAGAKGDTQHLATAAEMGHADVVRVLLNANVAVGSNTSSEVRSKRTSRAGG